MLLSRELRFSVREAFVPAAGINNFSGHPTLDGIAPFLTLTAVIEGHPDPQTGMLLNIKHIDQLLRQNSVPQIQIYHQNSLQPQQPWGGADLIQKLFAGLQSSIQPHRLHSLRLALSPFLSLGAVAKELPMIRLSERFEFSAAHRLHCESLSEQANQAVFGKCNNPGGHGHNYEIEVVVAGQPDAKTGLVIAVGELHRIVNQRVIMAFDHKHLNVDCAEFKTLNPTVENISQVIFDKLAGAFTGACELHTVRVWETPKTCSEVSRPLRSARDL